MRHTKSKPKTAKIEIPQPEAPEEANVKVTEKAKDKPSKNKKIFFVLKTQK